MQMEFSNAAASCLSPVILLYRQEVHLSGYKSATTGYHHHGFWLCFWNYL